MVWVLASFLHRIKRIRIFHSAVIKGMAGKVTQVKFDAVAVVAVSSN